VCCWFALVSERVSRRSRMNELKTWMRQKSNALTYSDAGEWQAKAAAPVSSIAERPVQQWTYTRFYFVVPLQEVIVDLTSHRVIVRFVPSFFRVLLWTIFTTVAFAFMAYGAGCQWWSFLVAAIGAGLGFLAAFRMLPVTTWITTLQDINAINYGASAANLGPMGYLFIFLCFFAGGDLAYSGNNTGQALFWGLTAVVITAYFCTIFRRTMVNLTIGGRTNGSEFSFPIDPFDMEPLRNKLLENKLALDYGTELQSSGAPISNAAQPESEPVRGYQAFGDL